MKSRSSQTNMPGTAGDPAGLARRLAAAPLKPKKAQERCDIGLFGDESQQIDLIDQIRRVDERLPITKIADE